MKLLFINTCLFILIYFLSGCSNWNKISNDVDESVLLSTELLSTELFNNCLKLESIIALETNELCLVKSIRRMILHDEKLYILNGFQELLMIDSRTGNYLGHIKNVGNGPGEYTQIVDFTICDDSNNVVIYSDGMKLLYYDLGLNYLMEQDVSGELYECITYSDDMFYFYNSMGTTNKSIIAIYNTKTKEWTEKEGGLTCESNIRVEGVPLVKSKSIWYTVPLESKLYCIEKSGRKEVYQLLMNNFGSKDKLLALKNNPMKFFEYINKENINYGLTSIRETSKSIYCKSNLYSLIVIDKESKKANYVRRLFDPTLGAATLKYISHDNDDRMIVFILPAKEWHLVDQENIPVEILHGMPKREIDEESNCLLLFYSERK